MITKIQIDELETQLAKAKEAYAKKPKKVCPKELKKLFSDADCISIDGSPLLTNIYCDEDMLLDTKWNEDDLTFECSIEYDEIRSIFYYPKTNTYEISTNKETSKIQIYTLNNLGVAA